MNFGARCGKNIYRMNAPKLTPPQQAVNQRVQMASSEDKIASIVATSFLDYHRICYV